MLLLPRSVCRAILDHARHELPREACGLLVGRSTSGQHEALEWVAARNTNPDPTRRFDLETECFLRTERRARARGLEIVGLVHSHPSSRAWPSALDAQFAWPELSSMIVARERGHWVMRSFRRVAGQLREEPVAVGLPKKSVTGLADMRTPSRAIAPSTLGASR